MNKYEETINMLKDELNNVPLNTVKDVRDFCTKHYNDGLSSIEECWENVDIQEEIDKGTIKDALLTNASLELEIFADLDYYDEVSTEPNDDEVNDDETVDDDFYGDEEEKNNNEDNEIIKRSMRERWDEVGMHPRDFLDPSAFRF